MKNSTQAFCQAVWQYYDEHGRHDLPWRAPLADGSFDPYRILVSEMMLQQTQVPRVIPKFLAFTRQFPDVRTLAAAPLGEVLAAWNGLGYNRRAKFLWQAAQKIQQDFGSAFPNAPDKLQALPGVGPNTAGAIAAYAFNQPLVFIETNIRTVFIHHFFPGQAVVTDTAVRELVEATLDRKQPRLWYWALMDYGTYLKQTVGNVGKVSKSYVKQSKFAGSRRQLRGQIIRDLVVAPQSPAELARQYPDERLEGVLDDLVKEGMIERQDSVFTIAN